MRFSAPIGNGPRVSRATFLLAFGFAMIGVLGLTPLLAPADAVAQGEAVPSAKSVVDKAIMDLGVDPEKPNPVIS